MILLQTPPKGGLKTLFYDVILAIKVVQAKLVFVGPIFVVTAIRGELDLPAAGDHLRRHLALCRCSERHVWEITLADTCFLYLAFIYTQAICKVGFCTLDG